MLKTMTSIKAQPVIITNNIRIILNSLHMLDRKAAEYIGLHHYYITKCLLRQGIYRIKI